MEAILNDIADTCLLLLQNCQPLLLDIMLNCILVITNSIIETRLAPCQVWTGKGAGLTTQQHNSLAKCHWNMTF